MGARVGANVSIIPISDLSLPSVLQWIFRNNSI